MAISSVTRILESVRNSHGLTRSLGEIQLWREADRSIFYRVGNSVVLFKIRHCGEWRAMRCYMRHLPNLKEIYADRYLPCELYVYSGAHTGLWIDVVLERWVDGVTLKERVERAVREEDSTTLRLLADRFDALAKELLSGDWAHGDLTAENILVTPELQIRLIDFDCKFIPQFIGRKSPELGTAAYQPPSRGILDFDSNIDDYSIALISTALRALSVDCGLFHRYRFLDGLIYDPALIDRGECKALEESARLFLSLNMVVPYRIANLLRMNTLRIAPLADIMRCVASGAASRSASRSASDCEDLHMVMQHGYVGYANADGLVIIPCIYDDGLEFSEGMVIVRISSQYLGLNPRGEVIAHFKGYERVKSRRNGIIRGYKNGKWVEI